MIYLTIALKLPGGWRTFRLLAYGSNVQNADTIHLPRFPEGFPVGRLFELRNVEHRTYVMEREELVYDLEAFGASDHPEPFSPEEERAVVAYLKDAGWHETIWPPKD